MRVDLRVEHDIEARKAAIGLFERGHGFESAAKALSVPRNTVRQWLVSANLKLTTFANASRRMR